MSFAEVSVNLPAGRKQLFTYSIPHGVEVVPGSGVWVPFGARTAQGIVVEVAELTAVGAVRPIEGLVQPEPVISPAQLSLARWIADYYFSSLFDALALFLPPGFIRRAIPVLSLTEHGASSDNDLDAEGLEALCLLKEKGGLSFKELEGTLGKRVARRSVSTLLKSGGIVKSFEILPPRVRPKTELYVRLASSEQDVSIFKRSPRRAALLNYLQGQVGAVSLTQLRAGGFHRALVTALVAAGAVITEERVVTRRPLINGQTEAVLPYEPTSTQRHAIATINDSLTAGRDDIFLLRGVTGSGKTEVYLQALAHAISLGKQGIVLVPEIVLTPQTVERFAARFPGRTAVLHSKLSLGEQHDTWRDIKNGLYDVVIGARSALFAPLSRLGIIVIDEEHEWTYKQSDCLPCYHARTVAIKLAAISGATVVLGSATPDVESYYLAKSGFYHLLELPERITPCPGSPLPAVQVVDLRTELKAGNRSIFSSKLLQEMRQTLAVAEQVILFFNRRGSATTVQCRSCGYIVTCQRCSVALSYHGAEESLTCHQCGKRRSVPEKCLACGSRRIRFLGLGTQKVMEEATTLFPAARILRWDSDAARGKDVHTTIMAKMRRREVDILVGTQLVAKGLDLPGVTLVGVISADTALGLPDFRSGERTFQLLSQVAGRAGRGQIPGRVIVQTYTPEHYAVRAAAMHDYNSFYQQEIEYRHILGNPPFSQLVRLTLSRVNDGFCLTQAKNLHKQLTQEIQARGLAVTIIGPAPAFIPLVRGHYRWQLILKGNKPTEILRELKLHRDWIIEVDPVGL